jgi:predicted DNA binding protein
MGIATLNMKKGFTIEDLDLPEYIDMLTVLKKDGDKYIVFSKVTFFKKFINLAKEFDLDIIWDTPSFFRKDKMVISVIGNEENLKKVLDVIKHLGEIISTSFTKVIFSERTILSCLTDRQKEILIAAKKNGYYSYPRKISCQELSEKIGLSKPTIIQHLRKAEVRLVSNILKGY